MRKMRIILLLLTVFSIGITYSVFQSGSHMNIDDMKIAKFLFDSELQDDINLEVSSLLPGDEKEYQFAVTNRLGDAQSDVSVEYQISLSTYHFIPLDIELYLLDGEEILVLDCDESYSRNEYNELVCNTEPRILLHDENKNHNYSLKLIFNEEYNDEAFSGLVDFIKVDIKSWQITGS